MFHVKRTLGALFHVKQCINRMNKASLFADTEFPEDHVKNILNVNPAEQPPQGICRHPQILSSELLTLPDGPDAAPQRNSGLMQ